MTRRLFTLGFGLVFTLLGAQVPRPAPEFVIRSVNGQQTLLSSYRGKVVVLQFLYTTCPHCQNCSAILNKLYKEYGPRGFQPIGIAFNDMAGLLVPDYVKQLGLNFPVGISDRDTVLTYLQLPVMDRFFVPQLVFIDRKGVIRAQHSGDDGFFNNEEANIRAELDTLLKEPAASKTRAPKRRAISAHARKALR